MFLFFNRRSHQRSCQFWKEGKRVAGPFSLFLLSLEEPIKEFDSDQIGVELKESTQVWIF